jgi:DNA primase
LLGRYTHEVVVSYDPDSAGIAATQRSLDLFLEADFRVKVLSLPDGQDPDVFVRTSGAEEYTRRALTAVPYLDFVLDAAIRTEGSVSDPKKKVQVMNTVLPYLAKLPNAVERSEYVFQFARKLGIEDQQLLAETKRAAQQKRGRLAEESVSSVTAMKGAEKRLLQVLLGNSELQDMILPICSRQDFEGLSTEKIFSILLDDFENHEISTYGNLHRRLVGESEQALLAQLEIEEVPESPTQSMAESYLNALRTMRLAAYKQQIVTKIAEAAALKDDALLNHLLEERVLVDRELVSLSRK